MGGASGNRRCFQRQLARGADEGGEQRYLKTWRVLRHPSVPPALRGEAQILHGQYQGRTEMGVIYEVAVTRCGTADALKNAVAAGQSYPTMVVS